MDKQYELYCLAHDLFYDSPDRNGRARHFKIIDQPLPDGWKQAPSGDWMQFWPPGAAIPAQGWKIHVSACQDNAAQTLAAVREYCLPRAIPFKLVSSPFGILARNMKYAPREASGKAATVYPADEGACERILRELDARLGGAAGPCILSDLRYGQGPLHVRYGGFTPRSCRNASGDPVPAIEDPSGRLVPDSRSPVFTVPEWVTLPEFLTPHLAARNAVSLSGLPYKVTSALHFSNGGGVYAATDKRDGAQIILKEARPHAGLAADGSDAVARLGREHEMMRRLSGLGIAPEVIDYFEAGGHHFLVEERIGGQELNSIVVGKYPLEAPDPAPQALAGYTAWAMRTCASIERAVARMHERGVVFNDLHMMNIMIRPDETVALIDFEVATDAGDPSRRALGNPGFAAPRDRSGPAVDAYSLACLRMALFMPLTTLFPLDPGKAGHLATQIATVFPVPPAFLDEAVARIAGGAPSPVPAQRRPPEDEPSAPARPRSRGRAPGGAGPQPGARDVAGAGAAGALVAAIRASATPQRPDRLFPGDVAQFRMAGGGVALGCGAAGVLFALAEGAGVREPQYEEWLLARAQDPPPGMKPGLYDGLAGVAWTLARLGHREAAASLAGRCGDIPWSELGHDLSGGLTGIALALLDVAALTGVAALADAGQRAAETVASGALPRAAAGDEARAASRAATGQAGLMHGAAGRALLFIRMHERTGDAGYLDAAEAALTAALGQCTASRDGGLQVAEGGRTLPYLKDGSAGIGLVIDQFLGRRDHSGLQAAAGEIARAASGTYYAQPGLFNGRAGLLYYLAGRSSSARAAAAGPEAGRGPAALPAAGTPVATHVSRLGWHAVAYGGGVAFPGDMLYRLSMDLGTGTAGVLLALARARRPGAGLLPGFAQLPGPPAPPRP